MNPSILRNLLVVCLTALFSISALAADKIVYPEYPGGVTELKKYLSESIVYPTAARKMEIEGEVVVEFTVERNGNLTGINIKKGLATELDQEALRVTRNMPAWKPGTKNGVPVRVTMTMPINFKIHKVEGYLNSSQEVTTKKGRHNRHQRVKKEEKTQVQSLNDTLATVPAI